MRVKHGRSWSEPDEGRPADPFHVETLDPVERFLHGGQVMPHQFTGGQRAEPDRGHRGQDHEFLRNTRRQEILGPDLLPSVW